ncbi:hypothetical protein [Trichocoleus sp. FACHB-262]|uniref:hypothetical protein n=1 Tax=Trichocoleus sp. FACHB-262 TaxID=2692869 RepID=UPI001682B57B|nr:hypothetical protein [Trichocoleus sp. FACHB-262]MBD2121793.1 hypothetical protein [Trichocoleus sp. FACHB-262]
MLRSLRLTALVSAALTAFLPKVAFSQLPVGEAAYPTVANPNTDVPLCYFQGENGQTFDLGKLCNQNAPRVEVASTSFGAQNCYFVDATGRPCAPPASQPQSQPMINQVVPSIPLRP